MDNNFFPYLCGGIFFSFLIELHNETAKVYNRSFGNDVMNQTKIMKELIYAINPNYSYNPNATDTLKKETSKYHTCQTSGGNIIPFELDNTRTSFDDSVKKHYDEVLERMTEFTTKCFPTYNDTSIRALVRITLILIRDDNSIGNTTSFFINEDGSSISKEILLKKKDFNFQSFLVGVWHYIITKPTKNKKGIQTFERLFPKYDGEKRKLNTQCLKSYAPEINVMWRKTSKESIPEKIFENKDTVEPPKIGRNEKLSVKIFYRGSLLDDKDEKTILSFSPAIIDLDKSPNISIDSNPVSTIYKITTEFQFETHFLSFTEEIIRLSCDVGSASISGTTSLERWLSRSKLNEMRFRKKCLCTAWFRLEKCSENEYSAEFLLIGRIIE